MVTANVTDLLNDTGHALCLIALFCPIVLSILSLGVDGFLYCVHRIQSQERRFDPWLFTQVVSMFCKEETRTGIYTRWGGAYEETVEWQVIKPTLFTWFLLGCGMLGILLMLS